MNLDDPEVSILEKQLESRVKKNIFDAKGKEVNLDYFLYSCFEQEQTRKAISAGSTAGQWVEIYKHEVAEGDLEDLIRDLCSWYSVQSPEMSSSGVLDHGMAAEVVPTFVRLIHDLIEVYKVKTSTEKAPDRCGEDGKQDKFWVTVDEEISKKFFRHAPQMLAYLDWRFGPGSSEVIDLASMPPVGRHARLLLRGRIKKKGPMRDKKPSSAGGRPPQRAQANGNGGGQNRNEGGRPERNGGGQNRNEGGRPERSGGGQNRNEGGRPERKPDDSRFSGPKKDHQSRGDKRPSAQDVDREKMVLAEAESGVDKLRQEPGLSEVLLKPQNSFLRRIQHQFIVDAGFKSESSGEAADRAVKILR
jgi:hypothetical protein